MNELPRQKLREIVVSYGFAICDDSQRCKALLLDLCRGEYRAEIRVIVTAQEEHIASTLLNSSSHEPYTLLFARLTRHMHENCGFREDVARWAVESWALALGVSPNPSSTRQAAANPEKPLHTWYIMGESVRGAAHKRANLPNQDALLWHQPAETGLPIIFSLADGYSGNAHFCSDIGAAFATSTAIQELTGFERQLAASATNYTLVSPVTDTSLIDRLVWKLQERIIEQWTSKVDAHWLKTPYTPQQWAMFQQSEQATDQEALRRNPRLPYTTGLVMVLLTSSYIFCLQAGTGHIMLVGQDGQRFIPLHKHESLNLVDHTLGSQNADHLFAYSFHYLGKSPLVLILLSTSGYAKSFKSQADFLKTGPDIVNLLYKNGLSYAQSELRGMLTEMATRGSGDDITLGLICHTSGLRP